MNNVGFSRAHCLRDLLFCIPLFESNFSKYKYYTSFACHRRQQNNWKGKVRGEETVQGKGMEWGLYGSKKPDGHRLSCLHCKAGDVLPLSWIQTCSSKAETRQFLLSLTICKLRALSKSQNIKTTCLSLSCSSLYLVACAYLGAYPKSLVECLGEGFGPSQLCLQRMDFQIENCRYRQYSRCVELVWLQRPTKCIP